MTNEEIEQSAADIVCWHVYVEMGCQPEDAVQRRAGRGVAPNPVLQKAVAGSLRKLVAQAYEEAEQILAAWDIYGSEVDAHKIIAKLQESIRALRDSLVEAFPS